jgi:hypothetical protein
MGEIFEYQRVGKGQEIASKMYRNSQEEMKWRKNLDNVWTK